MEKIYDLAIIGGGPAGLSAAIYAGRAKLRVLLIEKGEIGGQVNTTYEIANYPGARNTTGPKLMGEMIEQAKDFGTTFVSETREQTWINEFGGSKKIESHHF